MNVENIRLNDGLDSREIKTLKKLSSSEIIRKLGGKEKIVKDILDKYYHFNRLFDKGKIASIYKKARKIPSFAAMLQLYLKIKGKYTAKIDGDFGRKSLNALQSLTKKVDTNEEKEYESILRLEKMKDAIRMGKVVIGRYKLTYKKLLSYKERGINRIKLRYSGVKYDWVKVSDAIQLYKDMIRAGEISIRVDSAGVRNARDYRYNEEAAQRQLSQEIENIPSGRKGLLSMTFATARKYLKMGASEHKRWFVNKIKGMYGADIRSTAWCDLFTELVVNEAAKKQGVKLNIKNKMGRSAAGALGYPISGAHIGISDGKGSAIFGNDGAGIDRVSYHSISKERFYGWVYPWDYGNKHKVHWAKDMRPGEVPPAGAIVVQKQARGGASVERRLRKIAGYWGGRKGRRYA